MTNEWLTSLVRSKAFWVWLRVTLVLEVLAYGIEGHAPRMLDFRSFYSAGKIVWTAPTQLYNLALQKQVQDHFISPQYLLLPYYHPSYEALVYAPFALFPYAAAYPLFVGLNCCLAALLYWLAPKVRDEVLARRSRALLIFLFPPVLQATIHGQDTVLVAVICCLCLRQVNDGNHGLAGCFLACALFRPQLAIPIVVLLACRLGWRVLAGFGATGAALAALSVGLVGVKGVGEFWRIVTKASLVSNKGVMAQESIAVYPRAMPNVCGLVHLLTMHFTSPRIVFAMVVTASAVFMLMSVYLVRRAKRTDEAFAVAVLCAILVSYHLYLHDLPMLLVPISLLEGRLHRYLTLVAFVLPPLLMFSTGGEWLALLAAIPLGYLFVAGRAIVRDGVELRDEREAKPDSLAPMGVEVR